MPVYYFDIRDAEGMHRDTVGVQLPNMDAAIIEGRRTLAEMSQEAVRDGRADSQFQISIRDHDEGRVQLTLSLDTIRDGNKS